MTQSVLILGANGKFGAAAKTAFTSAGWHVRTFDRMRGNLKDAVRGVNVVVNAWNPPSYHLWAKELLAMHQRVIDALKGSDTTVIVPGNVYVFGPQTPTPWSEHSTFAAENPLGLLRIRMEAAYRASGIKTIILRAGDFLDTRPSGGWFDMVMAKSLAKGVFTYPGATNIPHAWAYLPDMARAAVQVCEKRKDLPRFLDIPFEGYTLTAEEIATALSEILGKTIPVKKFDWLPIRPLGLFMPSLRGLPEMRYLWDTPHELDGSLLQQLLPEFRPTPLNVALQTAVAHLALDRSGVGVPRPALQS